VTQQSRESGPDPIGDIQRWLFRSGARGVRRELGGQIRTVLGRNGGTSDVWERATADPPPGEAPECAWCPVCRAARMLRESQPGFASQLAAVGGAFATVVQDVASAVEATMAAGGQRPGQSPPAGERRPPGGSGEPSGEPDDRG
jgi:hypothetical protein